MKNKLITVLLLLVSTLCIAQTSANDKKIYLDSTWNETSQKNSKYYRIVKDYYLDKNLYVINDYYETGVLQMEGFSKTKDGFIKEGKFVFYFRNGNKKELIHYQKFQPIGFCAQWYEDGSKKLEGQYVEEEKPLINVLRVDRFWNSKGIQTVVDGNGDFEENSEFFYASGKVKDGFKDGFWEGSDKKMEYTFSETYGETKLISGVTTDKFGQLHSYTELEIRPLPEKGMEGFYKYIGRNFVCPKVEGLHGKIYIKFVIEKDGSVNDIKVLRDIGYGTGAEAVRVLQGCENWIPGLQRGIKVRCTFSLPISVQAR